LAAEEALGLVDTESVELVGKVSLGEGNAVSQVGRDDAPEEKEAEAGQQEDDAHIAQPMAVLFQSFLQILWYHLNHRSI
jgi:hypothetical protein